MSWQEFCRLNADTIGPRYARAHKEKLRIPDDDLGSYKQKIEFLVESPRSLLLLGPAGRGKTYFLFALLRAMFEAQIIRLEDIRFFRSIALDSMLVSEYERYRNIEPFIKTLSELPVLCIDDFGLDRGTEKAERDYYDLIDRRTSFERLTIFSSNLDESSIRRIFGERIASRLKACAVIEFNGPDLRGGGRI
jgi:DNA replication protein DnaC